MQQHGHGLGRVDQARRPGPHLLPNRRGTAAADGRQLEVGEPARREVGERRRLRDRRPGAGRRTEPPTCVQASHGSRLRRSSSGSVRSVSSRWRRGSARSSRTAPCPSHARRARCSCGDRRARARAAPPRPRPSGPGPTGAAGRGPPRRPRGPTPSPTARQQPRRPRSPRAGRAGPAASPLGARVQVAVPRLGPVVDRPAQREVQAVGVRRGVGVDLERRPGCGRVGPRRR